MAASTGFQIISEEGDIIEVDTAVAFQWFRTNLTHHLSVDGGNGERLSNLKQPTFTLKFISSKTIRDVLQWAVLNQVELDKNNNVSIHGIQNDWKKELSSYQPSTLFDIMHAANELGFRQLADIILEIISKSPMLKDDSADDILELFKYLAKPVIVTQTGGTDENIPASPFSLSEFIF